MSRDDSNEASARVKFLPKSRIDCSAIGRYHTGVHDGPTSSNKSEIPTNDGSGVVSFVSQILNQARDGNGSLLLAG
jgi:hypothetical protein